MYFDYFDIPYKETNLMLNNKNTSSWTKNLRLSEKNCISDEKYNAVKKLLKFLIEKNQIVINNFLNIYKINK